MALKNEDIPGEVLELMAAGKWTQTEVSRRMGIRDTHFKRTLLRPHIDKKLIDMLDAIGYDIEVKFVRKKNR